MQKDFHNEILNYSGPLQMKVIASFAQFLCDLLDSKEVPVMKAYRVFIELAQNTMFYSSSRLKLEQSSIGIGMIKLSQDENFIYLNTYNQILPEHKDVLQKNCERINFSSSAELKSLKETLRRNTSLTDSGAHIGLISIALYSENKLKYFFDYNENNKQFYFSITASISKLK